MADELGAGEYLAGGVGTEAYLAAGGVDTAEYLVGGAGTAEYFAGGVGTPEEYLLGARGERGAAAAELLPDFLIGWEGEVSLRSAIILTMIITIIRLMLSS